MKIRKEESGLVTGLGRRSDLAIKDQQSKNVSKNNLANAQDGEIKVNISTAKAIRDIVGVEPQDKIARIKAAIDSGSYKFNSDKVADSLVRHIQEESFFAKAEGGEDFSKSRNEEDSDLDKK